jgi:hypothetical protein
MKTIGFLQIDWTGAKSIGMHCVWLAVLTVAWYLVEMLTGHNFGMYQPLAVLVLGTVAAFLKTLCSEYQVPVPTQ